MWRVRYLRPLESAVWQLESVMHVGWEGWREWNLVFMASAQTNCSEELNRVVGVGNGKERGMR